MPRRCKAINCTSGYAATKKRPEVFKGDSFQFPCPFDKSKMLNKDETRSAHQIESDTQIFHEWVRLTGREPNDPDLKPEKWNEGWVMCDLHWTRVAMDDGTVRVPWVFQGGKSGNAPKIMPKNILPDGKLLSVPSSCQPKTPSKGRLTESSRNCVLNVTPFHEHHDLDEGDAIIDFETLKENILSGKANIHPRMDLDVEDLYPPDKP